MNPAAKASCSQTKQHSSSGSRLKKPPVERSHKLNAFWFFRGYSQHPSFKGGAIKSRQRCEMPNARIYLEWLGALARVKHFFYVAFNPFHWGHITLLRMRETQFDSKGSFIEQIILLSWEVFKVHLSWVDGHKIQMRLINTKICPWIASYMHVVCPLTVGKCQTMSVLISV